MWENTTGACGAVTAQQRIPQPLPTCDEHSQKARSGGCKALCGQPQPRRPALATRHPLQEQALCVGRTCAGPRPLHHKLSCPPLEVGRKARQAERVHAGGQPGIDRAQHLRGRARRSRACSVADGGKGSGCAACDQLPADGRHAERVWAPFTGAAGRRCNLELIDVRHTAAASWPGPRPHLPPCAPGAALRVHPAAQPAPTGDVWVARGSPAWRRHADSEAQQGLVPQEGAVCCHTSSPGSAIPAAPTLSRPAAHVSALPQPKKQAKAAAADCLKGSDAACAPGLQEAAPTCSSGGCSRPRHRPARMTAPPCAAP